MRHGRKRLPGMMAALTSCLLCVGLCMGSCARPALADGGVDWRIDDMGVRDAWAAGITGEGVKVAVIDDQVVRDYPALEGADVTYRLALKGADSCRAQSDESRVMTKQDMTMSTADGVNMTHGTHMVALIVGNGRGYDGGAGIQGIAPDASVTAYADGFGVTGGPLSGLMVDKCMDDDGNVADLTRSSIADAVDSGARIINMSSGSLLSFDDVSDYLYAVRHGVIVVSGRANDTYPGFYDLVGDPGKHNYFPGYVTVNSMARDGSVSATSDVMDGNVSILSPGVDVPTYYYAASRDLVYDDGGTSSAAADLTGYLALAAQKWPDATGNQLLQSLVRNTRGNDSGEARLDPEHRTGFGAVDLGRLLSVDPTGYPDVNPLLAWAVEASERHEETRGMYTNEELDAYRYYLSGQFSPEGEQVEYYRSCALIGREYERQKSAWERVEQCREDGGSDCMGLSATATAGDADGEAAAWLEDDGSSGLPAWVVPAAVGGVLLVVVGGVALAVVARRRARAGRRPPQGPPAVGGGTPYPPTRPTYPARPSSGPSYPASGPSYPSAGPAGSARPAYPSAGSSYPAAGGAARPPSQGRPGGGR